jgi:hypothetical protein
MTRWQRKGTEYPEPQIAVAAVSGVSITGDMSAASVSLCYVPLQRRQIAIPKLEDPEDLFLAAATLLNTEHETDRPRECHGSRPET